MRETSDKCAFHCNPNGGYRIQRFHAASSDCRARNSPIVNETGETTRLFSLGGVSTNIVPFPPTDFAAVARGYDLSDGRRASSRLTRAEDHPANSANRSAASSAELLPGGFPIAGPPERIIYSAELATEPSRCRPDNFCSA